MPKSKHRRKGRVRRRPPKRNLPSFYQNARAGKARRRRLMRPQRGIPSPIPTAEREWIPGEFGMICRRKKRKERR